MNLFSRWLAIGLVAGAAAIAHAAGGSGGGGGMDASPKRDAAFQAGVQAIERQDWKKAIALFQTSIMWDRFNADAHNWLGYAYRNTGDMKNAFAEYEEGAAARSGTQGRARVT